MREVGVSECCHPDPTTCPPCELRLASSVGTIAVTASRPPARAPVAPLRGARASTLASGCPGHPVAPPRLLLEVPSIGLRFGRPLPAPCSGELVAFGRFLPGNLSRSALVVSRHLDGFLRPRGAGVVAACCRSWGSPCFVRRAPRGVLLDCESPSGGRWAFPRCVHPSKMLPADSCSLAHRVVPEGPLRHARAMPPCRFTSDRLRGFAPSSGLLLVARRCRRSSCSVLPWASVPPSVPGVQRSVGNPLLAPDRPGASTPSVGRSRE